MTDRPSVLPAPSPAEPAPWAVPDSPSDPPAAAIGRHRSALPTTPVPYSQVLRGSRSSRGRSVVCLVLALLLFIVFSWALLAVPALFGLVAGSDDLVGYVARTLTDLTNVGPVGFLTLNLSLAMLLPIAMLSRWMAHGVRPRYLSSVAGGLRWGWLLRCVAVVAPLWAAYLGVSLALDPPAADRHPDWPLMLLVVLLVTPWQAAGEEYLFRGWVVQNVGAWFGRPAVAAVVSGAVSTLLFAAVHGSGDPWVFGSVACLGVAASYLAHRTGGLEAGIVLHATNNVLVFTVGLTVGGFSDAFVDGLSHGTPVQLALAVLAHGAAVLLVLHHARRRPPQRLTAPAGPTAPTVGDTGSCRSSLADSSAP